jgi:acylphosphatase
MIDLSSVKVIITGQVQGVMFRNFTCQKALSLGITGWVRNMADGRVEVVAEGQYNKLEELIKLLKQGPPQASVQKTSITRGTYSGKYADFEIRR